MYPWHTVCHGVLQGMGRGGKSPLFLLPSQQPLLLQAAAAAAQKAVRHSWPVGFDELKIRYMQQLQVADNLAAYKLF